MKSISNNRSLLSVAAGLTSGIMLALLPGLGMNVLSLFISYFATLPLFLIGFNFEFKYFGIAAGASMALILTLSAGAANLLVAATFLFWHILPAAWICFYTNKNKKQVNLTGDLICQMGLYAVALLIMAKHLPGFGGDNVIDLPTLQATLTSAQIPQQEIQRIVATLQRIAPYLSGIMIASWLLMVISNWFLARRLVYKSTIEPPTLSNLYLLLLAVVMAFGQLFSNVLAVNTMIVLFIPCFVTGLSTINIVVKAKRIHKLMLGIFYLSVVLFPIMVMFIVLLGIFEPWLNIRNKCTKISKG